MNLDKNLLHCVLGFAVRHGKGKKANSIIKNSRFLKMAASTD
jgi:hypothetical protein